MAHRAAVRRGRGRTQQRAVDRTPRIVYQRVQDRITAVPEVCENAIHFRGYIGLPVPVLECAGEPAQ